MLQRCVDAAKAVFKAIAVAEPRVRGAAKAGLKDALQQRYDLMREAVMARAAARVDQQLLKAAQQITTVRRCGLLSLSQWHLYVACLLCCDCCKREQLLQTCSCITVTAAHGNDYCRHADASLTGAPQHCCHAAQAARLHSRWVDVQGEVARTISEYDEQTSGPTKWPRLTAFLQQQYGHMVADFVQRCEAEADKKVCAWCLRDAPG